MDAHNDRETLDSFLCWLALKTSGLSNQVHLNKNQLQELLLGVALILRDLELSCFVDHEVTVPGYITNGCIKPSDIENIGRVVETLLKVIQEQLE
jgi:hypothetical protein